MAWGPQGEWKKDEKDVGIAYVKTLIEEAADKRGLEEFLGMYKEGDVILLVTEGNNHHGVTKLFGKREIKGPSSNPYGLRTEHVIWYSIGLSAWMS